MSLWVLACGCIWEVLTMPIEHVLIERGMVVCVSLWHLLVGISRRHGLPVPIKWIVSQRTIAVQHIECAASLSRRVRVLVVVPRLVYGSTTDIKAFVGNHNIVDILHDCGSVFTFRPDELFESGAVVDIVSVSWCGCTS